MTLVPRLPGSEARKYESERYVPAPVSEVLPLRLRLVAGYLTFTGAVGALGCAVATVALAFNWDVATLDPVSKVATGTLMSITSLYASRSLKRREKQGARIALGLFAAPFLYALLGRGAERGVGIWGVFAIVAILSTWKELD